MISGHISARTDQVKKDLSLECYCNVLQGALQEATSRRCDWAKGLTRRKETWPILEFSNIVNEKPKLLKQRQGNTSKKRFLEAQKKAKKAVYRTICKTEGKDLERG